MKNILDADILIFGGDVNAHPRKDLDRPYMMLRSSELKSVIKSTYLFSSLREEAKKQNKKSLPSNDMKALFPPPPPPPQTNQSVFFQYKKKKKKKKKKKFYPTNK